MKGSIVRIAPKFPMPTGYERRGKVIGENETSVVVQIEDKPVSILVRKTHIAVMSA